MKVVVCVCLVLLLLFVYFNQNVLMRSINE